MKEITRRLYTKPVMLGMAFLVGMALVVALFVTSKSTAATATFPVLHGNDEFETAADGQTFHDFGGSPIPADFFGTGSLAYSGLVPLQGVPLSSGSNVDTIIERSADVTAPGGSTPIAMTGLSLRSSSSITVSYSGGGKQYIATTAGFGGMLSDDYAATFGGVYKSMPRDDGALIVYSLK